MYYKHSGHLKSRALGRAAGSPLSGDAPLPRDQAPKLRASHLPCSVLGSGSQSLRGLSRALR